MNVLTFGGSNNKNSINKKLAIYAASLIADANIEVIDIDDFEMPIFSLHREQDTGVPQKALDFAAKIDQTDFIVLSLAEHNGTYTAAFKNIMDWTSRIKNRKTWADKPMLLMATSPGARGGIDVLNAAKVRFVFLGAQIKGVFSLPSFNQNFDDEKGIVNEELKASLLTILQNR